MNEITYLSGVDVREPVGDGRKVIGHVVNDLGKMGAGVALALLKKWPAVRSDYIEWHRSNNHNGHPFALGKVQFVSVEEDIAVANIIGQHDIRTIADVITFVELVFTLGLLHTSHI
jgi:hypothetical protein